MARILSKDGVLPLGTRKRGCYDLGGTQLWEPRKIPVFQRVLNQTHQAGVAPGPHFKSMYIGGTMKKTLFLLIILAGCYGYTHDNIISIVGGDGFVDIQEGQNSTTTSSTTTTQTTGSGCRRTTTTRSTSVYSSSRVSDSSMIRGPVFGLQYQRQVSNGVYLGTLIQTNQTYSMSVGIGF